MRPLFQQLDQELVKKIIAEAKIVLAEVGVDIADDETKQLLVDHGATANDAENRVLIADTMVEAALASAPGSFSLYDVLGEETHRFEGGRTHFTPGSAAINILDSASGKIRPGVTSDLVSLAKLVSGLKRYDAQSTALVASDVPEAISDSYRLFLGLLHCEKPAVTGAFTIGGFEVIHDLLLAVRGSVDELTAKPVGDAHLLSDRAFAVDR